MATVTKGRTFVSGEVVTPTKLNTLVDSATVTQIVDADISASAAISDTKLATISSANKVSNSATTATSANTASAIVTRDASGNFSAGTVTASLNGNANSATTATTATTANAIADGAVSTTDKIANGVVTSAKLSTGAPTWDTSGVVTARGGLNPIIQALPNAANGIGSFVSYATNAVNAIVGQLQMYSSIGGAVFNQVLNLPMLFMTNNAERMRISEDGNVGIGTSSPVARLDVVGSSQVSQPSGQTFGPAFYLNNTNNSGRNWYIVSAGSGNFAGLGNLEIGNVGGGGNVVCANPITNCPTTAKAWMFSYGIASAAGTWFPYGYNITSFQRGATAGLYTISFASGSIGGQPFISVNHSANNAGARVVSSGPSSCTIQTYVGTTNIDLAFGLVFFG